MEENLKDSKQFQVELSVIENPGELYDEKPICPDCGSCNYRTAGLTSYGIQRYKCKDCERKYQMTYLGMPQDPSKEVECRKCGNRRLRKCGKSTTGKQRYYVSPQNFGASTVLNVKCDQKKQGRNWGTATLI